ncbi:MAG: outer membrane lipoprotein-sorting protein [Calditrichaeota bacterium]|nr:MAG: outer membrane lipoprotein-sorting protein [Calditrichota bacterium]
MRYLVTVFMCMIIGWAEARTPDGNWVLQKVDENFGSESKITISEMNIKGRRGERTVVSKSWIQGKERSFTEYLEPPREKGTKMLKLDDQLWTYTPSTDRTILISGHMLHQSVMGSDLSYEDLLEDTRLADVYNARIIGEDTLLQRQCWILELSAKEEDVAYARRKTWVDQERCVIMREERFAKSGKLLKTTSMNKVELIDNRWVATHITFKDVLKSGEGTDFMIKSIEFGPPIPEFMFSKAALRR